MARRDQYVVDGAVRNSGKLYYPVPEPQATRWVIVREIDEGPGEMPSPVLIGDFESREVAEMLCELIVRTGRD